MEEQPKLYMMLLGCRPTGRLIEQHDIFFSIGHSMKDLVPSIKNFWPEAKGVMHVDAWRSVTQVGNYNIRVEKRIENENSNQHQLFFVNLGGYKPGEFDEFHYKMLIVAKDKGEAIQQAKQTYFYKHTGFKGGESHVDDKYGIDVDDVFEIKDVLSAHKGEYQLRITEHIADEDPMNLGYFKLDKL